MSFPLISSEGAALTNSNPIAVTTPTTGTFDDTDIGNVAASATPPVPATPTVSPPPDDLGFGRVVAQRSRGRLFNRDGTSTATKYGLRAQRTERLYLTALQAPWAVFVLWMFGAVLLLNGIFALAYAALPAGSLLGAEALGIRDPFLRAFVFSTGIFTTTGTGPLHAVGITANWLVVIESLAGPLTLVLVGGLLLARLIRPRAQLRFSESAVVAPYDGGRALMFRLVNELPSHMTDVRADVSLSLYETLNGKRERNFHQLALERSQVALFPLHWTIVHPITADSPLHGFTPQQLRESEAELLILISAHEETFSTHVSVRASYYWDDITWDAKFADIFAQAAGESIAIDVERLDRLDRLPEGATSVPSAKELTKKD